MARSGNQQPAIDNAEHIGPDDTGDNIEAKRAANYIWDGANWQRMTQPGSTTSVVDAGNSTTTPLTSSASFTGAGVNVLDYSYVMVYVYSDKSSAANGVQIQFSDDNTNWNDASPYTYTAGGTAPNDGQVFTAVVRGKYARIKYINTNSAQTSFRLQTTLCMMAMGGDVVSVNQSLNANNHAQIVNAQIFGLSTAGGGAYVPVKVNPAGNLGIANSSVSATGAAVPTDATYIGVISGGNLIGMIQPTTPTDTQPISAASLPLPSGAATSAKQDTGNTSVASIDTNTGYKFAPGKLRYTNIISASTSITPTAGKAVRVINVQVVPASANASDVQIYIHFATSSLDVFKGYAGGGYGIFTGATNEVLTITQTGTGNVQVLVDYLEI